MSKPMTPDGTMVYPPTMTENLLAAEGKLDLYKIDPLYPPGDVRRYLAKPDQPS